MAGLDKPDGPQFAETLDDMIAKRVDFLDRLPERGLCRALSRRSSTRSAWPKPSQAPAATDLTEAVARNLFKLMAYKDEYEVARLYTDGSFPKKLKEKFEGDFTLSFHLAPPIFASATRRRPALKKRVRPLDAAAASACWQG